MDRLSDLAARKMMADGCGKMFYPAGIGGQVTGILTTIKDADVILVIDGCPVYCAKKNFGTGGTHGFSDPEKSI
ncbi:hypothetical protein JW835_04370 [bacterium]|nr:hypothetical protein [bacterium]